MVENNVEEINIMVSLAWPKSGSPKFSQRELCFYNKFSSILSNIPVPAAVINK